ncbi:type IV secretion system protein VirD4 [Allofournierella massiliensis]|uniref:Type IV secretion system protein VirD4 n=2 Tax=Allofournierella massiliensis TaxID=1650663 RepID=A0A4R1QKZ9_9FIRM|nr:type IV secretory system conjugative DNA transfer family protein [Fournierella massiliensis]TCL54358.1 type IV secretion system protein VirD4 [Fournierella massiliensis]
MASPDFFTCLTSVLHPPYGVYGALICIGLLAILLLMVMRMGYSDTGEYDTDRNFIYSAKGTYGTSGWMSRKEMAGVLDLVPDLRKHKGVVLGMLDGKAVCIPEEPRINGNLAVYGSSGSMKTRSFCMNRILQAVVRGESLIISDPKSELYEKSSEYLRDQGYCVKIFNLVSPENSDSWNCLSEVEGQELLAQIFVDVIIKNTTNNGKSDHFWDSCEMNLLKALVLYVDQSYAEQNRNIGEVYRLLTLSGESDLDSLFENLPPTHPAKAPYSLYKQASDTVRSGVIIGLGSRLQVFQSELIKKITTRDEIDLELPGQERCAYFLVTSDQDSTFDFLASLFLSFCFIKLVRYADKNCEGGKLPVPVHILGEELTACGTIPDLSRRLSVIRSRNISMSCVFQNLAGLQNRYPLNLWQEILGNCDAQLFLGCTDELTAEFISSRTGLASVSVSSKSKQLGTWRISNYTPEYRETSGVGKRPVLTPDEVLRLPITQALVIIRGQKVLKVDKMDYSKHPEASKLRSCKASAHIPDWQRAAQETPPPSATSSTSQAPTPKKPVKKKPKAATTSSGAKKAAAAPVGDTPDGIITTDKDSILS